MKRFVMRGTTFALLVIISLLACLFISFSLTGLYVFVVEDIPLEAFVLGGTCLVSILVFGIIMFCKEIYAYFSKVIIDKDMIVWVRPFRKRRSFPLAKLSFWGCVSFAPRSTMIYFCAEDETKLIAYLQSHQKECQKIFGVDRCNRRNNNGIEQLQLAVGTYIRQHFSGNNDLFILRYGSIRRAKILVNILKKDAMITGPQLIDTAYDWNSATKYVSE